MTPTLPTDAELLALGEAGAAQLDPVAWHYVQVLAERTRTQSGAAQALLQDKLAQALAQLRARLRNTPAPQNERPSAAPDDATTPDSPLAQLLQQMAPAPGPLAGAMPSTPSGKSGAGWRNESPRVRQFRKQLSRISVQKQVRQAIAQAPQNAGPINSHMLVLRALGLMRDISPDYLARFMTHLDTLCLDAAEQARLQTRKTGGSGKGKR